MSAHNAIDDLLSRLADIDAEIWHCRAKGAERSSHRVIDLEEQREAILREAELKFFLRPRPQAELTPSSRVADVPSR